MSPWLKLAATLGAWEAGWYLLHTQPERKRLYEKALAAARASGKPMLIVGAPDGDYGCGDPSKGDVVLDLRPAPGCPNAVVGSVEAIPYPTGYFGSTFCSHVLEHVCDPQRAEDELHRVADAVFVAWPRPWQVLAYAVPGHTWLMAPKAGQAGEPSRFTYTRIRPSSACNVPTRLGLGFAGLGALPSGIVRG